MGLELNVTKVGFCGSYFPAKSGQTKRAVIVLGGSDGSRSVPQRMAARFSENGLGLNALGLYYWNQPYLPPQLVKVPIEFVEAGVKWLQQAGFEQIAIYGISKGAELALLAASLIPQITCVIALSPSHCVYAGLGQNQRGKKGFLPASSFTWRGQEVPYVHGQNHPLGMLWRLVSQQQLNTCSYTKKL